MVPSWQAPGDPFLLATVVGAVTVACLWLTFPRVLSGLLALSLDRLRACSPEFASGDWKCIASKGALIQEAVAIKAFCETPTVCHAHENIFINSQTVVVT